VKMILFALKIIMVGQGRNIHLLPYIGCVLCWVSDKWVSDKWLFEEYIDFS